MIAYGLLASVWSLQTSLLMPGLEFEGVFDSENAICMNMTLGLMANSSQRAPLDNKIFSE